MSLGYIIEGLLYEIIILLEPRVHNFLCRCGQQSLLLSGDADGKMSKGSLVKLRKFMVAKEVSEYKNALLPRAQAGQAVQTD